eukprot:3058108-Heterocapsa_arctica.AAC.1
MEAVGEKDKGPVAEAARRLRSCSSSLALGILALLPVAGYFSARPDDWIGAADLLLQRQRLLLQ